MWTVNLFSQIQISIPEFYSFRSFRTSSINFNLPSNVEYYNSLRIASLGDGLNGIVSDGLTDYFRNPAYVNFVEQRVYYLDFDKKGSSNDLRITTFSSLLGGRFGLSFSGDVSEATSRNNRTDPELLLFDDTKYSISRINRSSFINYNLHFWWANSLSENIKYGFNYIRKTSDSDDSRTNTNSRQLKRTDAFLESTTIDNRTDINISESEIDINVNTFRGGFIFGTFPDMVVDLVLKAEFTELRNKVLSDRKSIRDYSNIQPNYIRITQSADTTSSVFSGRGNSAVYGLSFNIKNKINDSVVQSYLLSLEMISFDVSEKKTQNVSNFISQIRDSLFSNSTNLFLSQLNSDRTSATAYILRMGVGREIKLEKAIIGIGINATIASGNWDNNFSGVSTKFSEVSNNDTTYQLNQSADSATVISTDINTTLITFPIGGEFNVTESFRLRMGVEFNSLYKKNELSSSSGEILSLSKRNSYANSKSFGIGYIYSDKFRADLMVINDLARISSWRISIQYGL